MPNMTMAKQQKKAELLAQVERYLAAVNPSETLINELKGWVQSLDKAFPYLGQLLRALDKMRSELQEETLQTQRLNEAETQALIQSLKAKETVVREELARQRQIYQQELEQLIKVEASLFDSTEKTGESSTKTEAWFKEMLRQLSDHMAQFLEVLSELEGVIATIRESQQALSEVTLTLEGHTQQVDALSKKVSSIQQKIEAVKESKTHVDETYHEKQQKKLAEMLARQEAARREMAEAQEKRAHIEAALLQHKNFMEGLHKTYVETFTKVSALSSLLSSYKNEFSLPFAHVLHQAELLSRFAGVYFNASDTKSVDENVIFRPMMNRPFEF